MSDLISRQAAMDYIGSMNMVDQIDEQAYIEAMNYFESLPSAEPKTGRWVRNFDGNEWYWFCSNCKEEWYEEDLWMGGNDFPNYCPNCGSRMKGEEDDD